jgi:ATP-dependent RNA/DNA helicase IGHMBP2
MPVTDPHIKNLLYCIELEEAEQVKRYKLDEQHTLKSLKAEGLALHPITVKGKHFGYADYPEINFRLDFPADTNLFKDGAAIECFCAGEEQVKGILISLDGKVGELRLFAPDFPDWIEDKGVGIKLTPDQRTTAIMKQALENIEDNKYLYPLFKKLHGAALINNQDQPAPTVSLNFVNTTLNESQQNAVMAISQNEGVVILHGPPGTGKTTTLAEAVVQLVRAGKKIAVAAPGNTAVDNIAQSLLALGVNILRVGNTSKVNAVVFKYTPEGKLANSNQLKEIKQLKMRAEEFRKMAVKYKRNFGKAEREQRNLLFKEVKSIRAEIKKLQVYNEEKLYAQADVILGTPVGLYDAKLNNLNFDTLIMDEAGQCIEPLAWCIFPLAPKLVLAGDHLQLPPTVLSESAIKLGFNRSVLELSIGVLSPVFLLNIQYRMRKSIAGFCSAYFYKGLLQTALHLNDKEPPIFFIDTAGSGYNEINGNDGISLQNEGELKIVQKLLEADLLNPGEVVLISPYAGQVAAAREILPKEMRISTIDSFQGQEKEIVIVSLVRSNDEGVIGFLKDYRRMNVAITRAKERLYIIGDSATIGADAFYNALLIYIENHGVYKTVWEFDI